MRKHNNPTGKYKKAELRDSIGAETSTGNRYVISAAEGIYALEPSKIESLAFSREFLMFPLNVGWYFRENLLLCSYMDFEAEHAQERYRGTDSDRFITDSVTGRLLECRGQGTAVLKPSKDHVFIAFDIHNTSLSPRGDGGRVPGEPQMGERLAAQQEPQARNAELQGQGKIFIQLSGSLFNLELPDEEFLLTPMEKLIGWEGYVVAQCNQGELVHAAGSGNLFYETDA